MKLDPLFQKINSIIQCFFKESASLNNSFQVQTCLYLIQFQQPDSIARFHTQFDSVPNWLTLITKTTLYHYINMNQSYHILQNFVTCGSKQCIITGPLTVFYITKSMERLYSFKIIVLICDEQKMMSWEQDLCFSFSRSIAFV